MKTVPSQLFTYAQPVVGQPGSNDDSDDEGDDDDDDDGDDVQFVISCELLERKRQWVAIIKVQSASKRATHTFSS